MKILNKIRYGSELIGVGVVYIDNADMALRNSEVYSRIDGLTMGLPGTWRSA